jgi:hypothetical protein
MDKYRSLSFIIISITLLIGTLPSAYSESSEEFYMLSLINKERQAQGLSPLTMNSALSSAAKAHSQDMMNRSFFNHVNPDGLTPSDRAIKVGYTFSALGENICGNPSIDNGHSSLMGSPAHRDNILNPSFKEVGIGIVDGGPYGKMITQLFGTQLNGGTSPSYPSSSQDSSEKPDIIVGGINVSGKAETGNKLTMDITLTNTGKKNAPNFVFAIFDGGPDSGKLMGKSNIPSLYSGNNITVTLTWTPEKSGDYTIYFVSDYGNSVAEENENNNIFLYNISISNSSQNTASDAQNSSNNQIDTTSSVNSKPDIAISINESSYQSIVYENTSSNAYFRVKNIGKTTAYQVPIKVYLNGNLKTSTTIPQILSSTFSDFSILLSFTSPGEYIIEARVDPDNSIEEISELNNNVSFKIKVIEKNANTNKNQAQNIINNTSQDTDLLIYPYYIKIEELENGDLLIKTKIKNKGKVKVEDTYVSLYSRDTNNANMLIEKINISIYPDEILERNVVFTPLSNKGEIIVIIDEENKIIESDENNNIATKMFSINNNGTNTQNMNNNIINTAPEEANVTNYLRVTIKTMDINASNVYVNYKLDLNSSFTFAKMNNEGNGSYFIDIDVLGKDSLKYYFEVETLDKIIIYPSNAPTNVYEVKIHHKKEKDLPKESGNIVKNIKKILTNIF